MLTMSWRACRAAQDEAPPPPISSSPPRRASSTSGAVPRALAGLAGCAYGLGLARDLYERFPLSLGLLSGWPAALALTLALGGAAAILAARGGRAGLAFSLPLALPLISALAPDVNLTRSAALLAGGLGGALALHLLSAQMRPRRRDVLISLTLLLVTGALYLRTLAPTVGEADTFEFQVNSLRLAVAHPSGYPLYILLGRLFSLLPLGGTAAWRINLSSAASGAAAVIALYFLGLRLGARRAAAALAALAFGASFGLWSRAVEAEVYPLHAAFVAGILWLLLGVLTAENAAASARIIPALALVTGLSLTNHLTTALLMPAALVALLVGRFRVSLKTWALAAGLFLLGLSVYVYLPLRWPVINHGEVMTPKMLFEYVTGQPAQGALRLDAWARDPARYALIGQKALQQFGWPGALLAMLGLGHLILMHPAHATVLALAYAGFAFFGLSFYVPDPDFSAFLIPAHLIEAALIGVGISTISNFQPPTSNSKHRRSIHKFEVWSLKFGFPTLFLLLPLSLIWTNLPQVDKSRNWEKYELGRFILSLPLEPGAAVLADSEKIAPLFYLQVAEGLRPDLEVMVLPDEAAYRAELDARVSAGQTAYLGRYLPHLADAYRLRSLGPLTEVSRTAFRPATPPAVAHTRFGEQIELLGADKASFSAPAGEAIRLTLYWAALAPPDANYLVRFRLLDRARDTAMQTPGAVPVNSLLPTLAWMPGETLADFHTIPIDYSIAPGEYSLQVGLFRPFGDTGLTTDNGDQWQDIGSVTVTAPAAPPAIPQPARMYFGGALRAEDLWLMGWNAPEAVAPGTPVTVSLFWQSASPTAPPADYMLLDLSADTSPRILSAGQVIPSRWPARAVIQTLAQFTAPDEVGETPLGVRVRGREVQCGWLRVLRPVCPLAAVRAAGEAVVPGAVNFDNQIVLRRLSLETARASPGQVVFISAEWQGLRAMESNYTVFVHLIGPDGLLYGQVDAWPGQGARPTTGWQPGEVVRDRFEVRLSEAAAPGEYAVEVGWYRLETLQRLPVIGENGAPVDDKVLQSGLAVK